MAGTCGESKIPPLGDNMLPIDSITTKMKRMTREHTKELYHRIE